MCYHMNVEENQMQIKSNWVLGLGLGLGLDKVFGPGLK